MECIFCNIKDPKFENGLAVAILDRFPVNKGHLLIIPKRHTESFFNATEEERLALIDLLDLSREFLINNYHPDGFNIGINDGLAAGQTILHLHIHLIPRYFGDISNPKGGVRGVIPEKRIY